MSCEYNFHTPSADEVAAQLDKVYEQRKAFLQKTEGNKASGIEAYESGDITPWTGFNRELFDRKITILGEFDEQSSNEIFERVTQPLHEVAQSNGIYLANQGINDLNPHVTLQFPHFSKGTDPAYITHTLEQISTDGVPLQTITQRLVGEVLPMDTVVGAGPMIYIAIGDPLRSQQTFETVWRLSAMRDRVNSLLNAYSLENPSYSDIIHSVVGRVMASESDANFRSFIEKTYNDIAVPVNERPLRARIGHAYAGSIIKYINTISPGIVG